MKTSLLVLSVGLSLPLKAETLTFDTPTTPGLNVSFGVLHTTDDNPHYWLNNGTIDDFFNFTSPTYVNSFQMNAHRWTPEWTAALPTGYTMDIEAYSGGSVSGNVLSGGTMVWNTQVNLSGNTDWANWLTVNVEADDVTWLRFRAPNVTRDGQTAHTLYPSIDNMVINEFPVVNDTNPNSVPDSGSSAAILGLGVLGLVTFARSQKRATVSL